MSNKRKLSQSFVSKIIKTSVSTTNANLFLIEFTSNWWKFIEIVICSKSSSIFVVNYLLIIKAVFTPHDFFKYVWSFFFNIMHERINVLDPFWLWFSTSFLMLELDVFFTELSKSSNDMLFFLSISLDRGWLINDMSLVFDTCVNKE